MCVAAMLGVIATASAQPTGAPQRPARRAQDSGNSFGADRCGGDGSRRFSPDGGLEYLAIREKSLYRVQYTPEH
jgi:hypothetical protein